MSSSEKRILPTSSTAALVPISEVSFNERTYSRSNPNDELIDQLVGGLIQADHPAGDASRFSGQYNDFGANERTYSIDDEEIDEPPVPIPSTWRQPQNHQEPNWFVEQARASAYGFAVGLFVVIPAVMLLTGQAERLPSWQALVSYAQVTDSGTGIADQSGYGEVAPTQPVKPAGTPSETTAQSSVETATQTQATAVTTPAAQNEVAPTPTAPPETTISAATETPATDSPKTESLSEPAAATVAPERAEKTAAAPTENTAQQPAANETQTDVAAAAAARDEPPPAAPKATIVAVAPIVTTEPTVETPTTTETATAPATTTPTASDETPVQTPVQTPAPVTAAPPSTQPEAANSPESANEPTSETKTTAVAPTEQSSTEQAGRVAANPVTLEKARETIKAGDMDGARVMLARLASQGNSDAIFALAETFDPNVLAAWGTQGEEADSEKARMFYSMALAQGVDRAATRLQALQE